VDLDCLLPQALGILLEGHITLLLYPLQISPIRHSSSIVNVLLHEILGQVLPMDLSFKNHVAIGLVRLSKNVVINKGSLLAY